MTTKSRLFPLQFPDGLIQQAELTLNLLQLFCINLNLTAHAQLEVELHFNKTPFLPGHESLNKAHLQRFL